MEAQAESHEGLGGETEDRRKKLKAKSPEGENGILNQNEFLGTLTLDTNATEWKRIGCCFAVGNDD